MGFRQLLAVVAACLLSISWAPRGYGGAQGESITHADAVGVVAGRRDHVRDGTIESDEDAPSNPAGAAQLSARRGYGLTASAWEVLRRHAVAESNESDERRLPRVRGPPPRSV